MIVRVLMVSAAATLAVPASAAPEITVPKGVMLPELEPLIPACADPAADHFLEIDITRRPPPNVTRVGQLSGWITEDGVFHWPFVMRVRNLGDQPFIATKPGRQAAVVSEDDLATGKKGRIVGSTPFDRIDAHGAVSVPFEFTATAEAMQKRKFHRIFTLTVKYGNEDSALINGRNGDCNLRNNKFVIEFDGSRKEWIFGK